jgi:preprotein translocase SecE subunit
LNRENEVAKALGKITVSDDDVIESEAVEETADTPSSPPPVKTKTGTAGSDGDRPPKKTVTTPSLFERIRQFLHDTRAEMRRVSWPGASLVKNTTLITLVAVVFFALYLFAVDRVWAFLIEHLRTLLGG